MRPTLAYRPNVRIYWTVLHADGNRSAGAFWDLRTLKGATERCMRENRDWKEIEVRYV